MLFTREVQETKDEAEIQRIEHIKERINDIVEHEFSNIRIGIRKLKKEAFDFLNGYVKPEVLDDDKALTVFIKTLYLDIRAEKSRVNNLFILQSFLNTNETYISKELIGEFYKAKGFVETEIRMENYILGDSEVEYGLINSIIKQKLDECKIEENAIPSNLTSIELMKFLLEKTNLKLDPFFRPKNIMVKKLEN
jgi:hypothetical protein